MEITPKLGIDVGGVIIDGPNNDGTDTSFFSDNYLYTTAVEGAFEAIKILVEKFGPENTFIVSKAGQKTSKKTIHWLNHYNFFERTGFDRHNIHFCPTRSHKAPICADLGITHFIDDKLEVLNYLSTVPNLFWFHPSDSGVMNEIEGITQIRGWAELILWVAAEMSTESPPEAMPESEYRTSTPLQSQINRCLKFIEELCPGEDAGDIEISIQDDAAFVSLHQGTVKSVYWVGRSVEEVVSLWIHTVCNETPRYIRGRVNEPMMPGVKLPIMAEDSAGFKMIDFYK